MTLKAYKLQYEDLEDPTIMRTAAVRFDPDAAIRALNSLREQYPELTFWINPSIPEGGQRESAAL